MPFQEVLRVCNLTLTTAVTGDVTSGTFAPTNGRVESMNVLASFTYGSGGTTARAWLQTTLDGGTTWVDVACFAFTTSSADAVVNLTAAAVTSPATPGDAALADNTCVNGIMGNLFRVKVTSTGTYAGGTTLRIFVTPK